MKGTIRTFVAMPDWQQLEILRQAMPVFGPQFEQVGASVDGAALLRCLGEHPDRVELVLTDLFLRDMDAVELLEHMNQLQLAHPPRVLITAGLCAANCFHWERITAFPNPIRSKSCLSGHS